MEEIGNYDWMKIREFFVSEYLWKYDLLKKKNEIDSLRVNLDVDGAQFEQLYQNFYTDILSLQPFFFETDCVKIKIYKVVLNLSQKYRTSFRTFNCIINICLQILELWEKFANFRSFGGNKIDA